LARWLWILTSSALEILITKGGCLLLQERTADINLSPNHWPGSSFDIAVKALLNSFEFVKGDDVASLLGCLA